MLQTTHRSGDPLADRRADYAEAYARAGELEAAADLMRQAVERAPGWLLGRVRWAELAGEAGDRETAAEILRAVLAEDELDPYGASLKLARIGEAPVPSAPSPSFVAGLFDQYADTFEDSLVRRLGYSVPDKLIEMLLGAGMPNSLSSALDLGCGTGLMGERLRPHCARLHGIDLSTGMLDKARGKAIYDDLREGDILDAARADGRPYDLVTAADVLIYLGDLRPLFDRLATLQEVGGWLGLSTESNKATDDFVLRPSLRYAHAPAYVARLLPEAGYELRAERSVVVRLDRGEPVPGTILVARRV
ncbi:methyltransferase [Aureimonas sp. ME7]|uniref:methyltransferase n=1 Tax=Aureimonas sp. ME7 TaxID=2744252 RepID=UPI0015F4668A|nr:methyltransferase [Aureimonas sp. ME7]